MRVSVLLGLVCFLACPSVRGDEFTKVYWGEVQSGEIYRADLDGTDQELLVAGLPVVRDLQIDLHAGKMYWSEVDRIRRSDLNGQNVEEVAVDLVEVSDLALDVRAQQIYWVERVGKGMTPGKIVRANLDGSNKNNVLTELSLPEDLALDLTSGKVYWTHSGGSNDWVRRANLDGSLIEDVIPNAIEPGGIAVDAIQGRLYYSEAFPAHQIRRALLDGSELMTLVTEAVDVKGIAIDSVAGRIYWVESVGAVNRIRRAFIDGTGVETVLDCGRSFGIALGPGVVSPSVVEDPVSLVVEQHQSAEFHVSVAGSGPFEYQWRHDGVELVDGFGVAGSQTATLSLSARLSRVGYYDCVVTNKAGSDTSEGAVLGVRVACPADIDENIVVGFADLLELLAAWGPCGSNP